MTIDELVAKYLELRSYLSQAESQLSVVETAIGDYCRQNKQKIIKYQDQRLSVVQKSKVIFPAKSDPQRSELEKILAEFKVADDFRTIDITKLATAYEKRKLQKELMAALKSLTRSRPYIRITLLPSVKR